MSTKKRLALPDVLGGLDSLPEGSEAPRSGTAVPSDWRAACAREAFFRTENGELMPSLTREQVEEALAATRAVPKGDLGMSRVDILGDRFERAVAVGGHVVPSVTARRFPDSNGRYPGSTELVSIKIDGRLSDILPSECASTVLWLIAHAIAVAQGKPIHGGE